MMYMNACMYCILQNNGKLILWSHVRTIQEEIQSDSGLYVGKLLKPEHINLTSFSRMRVDLAAQVGGFTYTAYKLHMCMYMLVVCEVINHMVYHRHSALQWQT